MAKLLPWVIMPSEWIRNGGLKKFKWAGESPSDNTAALMTLAPILHRADRETGLAKLTYDDLQLATTLSRSKISAGLEMLEHRKLIERGHDGRSTFLLSDFNPSFGWAKLPARDLYRDKTVMFFEELKLRSRVELEALKLWYFFAARRDNDVNLAKVTYDHITDGTGIRRERIKGGLSLLAANAMVHVERIPSRHSEYGVANAYRLPQIDPSRHMGSVGRGMSIFDDFDFVEAPGL